MRGSRESRRVASWVLLIALVWRHGPILGVLAEAPVTAQSAYAATDEIVLKDYAQVVTTSDLGANRFGGNMGTINKDNWPYCTTTLAPDHPNGPCLLFRWDFRVHSESSAFCGMFSSLFGPTKLQCTLDGEQIVDISFPEHVLNLENIDAPISEPGGPRQIEDMALQVSYHGNTPLDLRVELKDSHTPAGGRWTRLHIEASQEPQTLRFCFRDPEAYQILNGRDLDLAAAKELVLVVEYKHHADDIENPKDGELYVHRIWFTADRAEEMPTTDEALMNLQARRAYQYFGDWASRKDGSMGIPQDRSTFGVLLTVGGIGFALPAHAIAAERGWITREEAAQRVLNVLRVLDDDEAYGPEPIGRIGYRGWLYHFLGPTGERKLNFDYDNTPDIDESLNTVELSSIDTGLAIMGALAAQSYFTDTASTVEKEIHDRVDSIYDRVDWAFMLDPATQQFYLGWKPNEPRQGPAFEFYDPSGLGAYSGTCHGQQTLDYYSDEGLILALLAMGSGDENISRSVYDAMVMSKKAGLIATWPGALFTYQFLGAFMNTSGWVPRPGDEPESWYANSALAISRTIAYAESTPSPYTTYGSNAWGISAAEGPFGAYHAYGAPPVAHCPEEHVEQDGTVTYYAMLSSAALGENFRQRAAEALRAGWERGHWHPRFGLPDAWNDEIAEADPPVDDDSIKRTRGPWVSNALYAIDQGPMLLCMENARSGLIWDLVATNTHIQDALACLQRPGAIEPADPPHRVVLEAEDGSGDGAPIKRTSASGGWVVHLDTGQAITIAATVDPCRTYALRCRYGNDNDGPTETLTIAVDGVALEPCETQDTGGWGHGWDVLVLTNGVRNSKRIGGPHTISVRVDGGDGGGVDVDAVTLDALYCPPCYLNCYTTLPLIVK